MSQTADYSTSHIFGYLVLVALQHERGVRTRKIVQSGRSVDPAVVEAAASLRHITTIKLPGCAHCWKNMTPGAILAEAALHPRTQSLFAQYPDRPLVVVDTRQAKGKPILQFRLVG